MGCEGGGGGCSNAVTGGALMEGTRKISGSNGMRMAGCSAPVTNRERTSSVADSEAADVWARTIEGSALLGAAAGAGGHHVIHRLVQFVRGALDFLEVVPQRPRYRLLDCVWICRHTPTPPMAWP